MKKLLTLALVISALMLVGCNNNNFSVADLTGNWMMSRDGVEIAVGQFTGGYSVMILNEDGTGLSGYTGTPRRVGSLTWEINNGNHLYLTGGNTTLRLEIVSYDDGVLRLAYLDFPAVDDSTYIRVDHIELTDDMIQQ